MNRDDDIKIFSGRPPNSNVSLNRQIKFSVLCSECKKKFKEFLKIGGAIPKACDICKDKLKDQMFSARYPDRETI